MFDMLEQEYILKSLKIRFDTFDGLCGRLHRGVKEQPFGDMGLFSSVVSGVAHL